MVYLSNANVDVRFHFISIQELQIVLLSKHVKVVCFLLVRLEEFF